MLRPIANRLFTQTVRRYHQGELKELRPPRMDELPVPAGSWQAHYDAKQRGYNGALALGIGFAVFTVVVAKMSGLVYFNWAPPKTLD